MKLLREDKEDQLFKGQKVEEEHKDTYAWIKDYYKKNNSFPPDKEFFRSIAEDHLKELPDYYDRLEKMEDE